MEQVIQGNLQIYKELFGAFCCGGKCRRSQRAVHGKCRRHDYAITLASQSASMRAKPSAGLIWGLRSRMALQSW